jgi:hypothetical protein
VGAGLSWRNIAITLKSLKSAELVKSVNNAGSPYERYDA